MSQQRLAFPGAPASTAPARRSSHLLYTVVVCTLLMASLAAWRYLAASQGLTFEDSWDAIGWLHRTFILTVVYVCGTAILSVR